MPRDYTTLTHPSIQTLLPYLPGKAIEELQRELGIDDIIKLASNENPLGPSPKALEAAQAALIHTALYPDANGYFLKQRLSAHLACPMSHLTLGDGSDNVLMLIAQAYAGMGYEIIAPQYSFATFKIIAHAIQAKFVEVPLKAWQYDVDGLLNAVNDKTRVIFIANPNNPTGSFLSEAALKILLSALPSQVILVIDEAYYEFVDDPDYPDTLALQQRYPNLVTTRTFSKAYGLAGFRVGYAVANPEITDILNRIRLPFNVNNLGLVAARAALSDHAHLTKTLETTQAGRKQLQAICDDLKLPYLPPCGNFLTVHVGERAESLYHGLLQKGIIVRPLTNYNLPEYLRISVGTPKELQRLHVAFKTLLREEP